MKKELKTIKKVILEVARKYRIEVDRIILFGSRARGDYREDSDWDILVVVRKKVDKKTLERFWDDLNWSLAKYVVPEVIVTDRESFEKYKRYPGYVHHWAEKEGVLVG